MTASLHRPLRDTADPAPAPDPDARTLPGHRVHVVMDTGEEFTVRVLNRDRVAWDRTAPRKGWGTVAEVPFLATTFLAWSAAKRDGLTALNFDAFCEHAEDVADVPATEDDTARPTRTAHALD